VNYLVIISLLRHQYLAVTHVMTHREILLSVVNRVSKIYVGLGPGSGFKMRPVCSSGTAGVRAVLVFAKHVVSPFRS